MRRTFTFVAGIPSIVTFRVPMRQRAKLPGVLFPTVSRRRRSPYPPDLHFSPPTAAACEKKAVIREKHKGRDSCLVIRVS